MTDDPKVRELRDVARRTGLTVEETLMSYVEGRTRKGTTSDTAEWLQAAFKVRLELRPDLYASRSQGAS